MYFGYGQMWKFTFVPVGFIITMVAFLAFCLVYAVGALWGKRAAIAWTNAWAVAFVVAAGVDMIWAFASGQWARFTIAYGVGPFFEMVVLALMCIGTMWFMAVSYVSSKQ